MLILYVPIPSSPPLRNPANNNKMRYLLSVYVAICSHSHTLKPYVLADLADCVFIFVLCRGEAFWHPSLHADY